MVKIGDEIKVKSEEVLKKADPPAAGASKGRSSEASVELRSSLEETEEVSASSVDTKKEGAKHKDTKSDKVSGRSKKEFYKNTVIGQSDVGETLFNIIEKTNRSADPVTELSETEQELLDRMIFKGHVSHTMYLKKDFPFSFRSCPPIAMNIGSDILQEYVNAGEEKISNLFTCMIIAVYLEEYGNKEEGNLHISHKSKTQEDFAEKEAIRERFDFCVKKLNGIVIDILQDRLREFLDLLNRVGKSRNIVNF